MVKQTDPFAVNIRRYRKAAGLTQEKAARGLDLATTTWVRWESGEAKPHLDTLHRIADLLGVTPADLLTPTPTESR